MLTPYMPIVFLSNDPLILLKKLDSILFKKSDPLAKTWVVTPNKEVASWINNEIGFSQARGIALGFSVISSTESLLHQLNGILFPDNPLLLPNDSLLYGTIQKILNQDERPHRNSDYNFKKKFFSTKNNRLSFEVVKTLSLLFKKYYFQNLSFSDKDHETKLLLSEIQKYFLPLNEILLLFKNKIEDGPDLLKLDSLNFIFFADFPFILREFFKEINPKIPVFFYQLSPCKEFWYDLYSDEELINLDISDTDDIFNHTVSYPLLNNFGVLSRPLFSYFEDNNFLIENEYQEKEPLNALNLFQNNLLNLSQPNLIEDGSLSITSGASRLREVESVCDRIAEIIRQNNLNFLGGIFISVISSQDYFPLIEQVFEKKIPYKISGRISKEIQDFKDKAELILSLIQSEISMEKIIFLLSHPEFLKKRSWQDNERLQIFSNIKKSKILWNYDHKDKSGLWITWCREILRAYPFLAFGEQLTSSSQQTAAIYGELALLFYNLNDFSLFSRKKQLLRDYKIQLQKILSLCFGVTEKEEALLHELNFTFFSSENNTQTDFTFFISYFLYAVNQSFSLFPSHIGNFVRVGYLTQLQHLPKEYSFILGCSEIKNTDNPFDVDNELSLKSEKEILSAFLYNSVSTTKELHLSYTSVSSDEENTAPVLQEYSKILPKEDIKYYSLQNYDSRYFVKPSYIFEPHKHRFLMACSFLDRSPKEKDFFSLHGSFASHQKNHSSHSTHLVTINDLIQCLKDPIAHFLKYNYSVKLKASYSPFVTPSFHPQSSFRKEVKKHYSKQTASLVSKPCLSKSFENFFNEQKEREILLLEKFLSLSTLDYTTVILSKTIVQDDQHSYKTYVRAPLSIDTDYGTVHIVGKISAVSSKGLYYPRQYEKSNLIPLQETLEMILLNLLDLNEDYQGAIFFLKEPDLKELENLMNNIETPGYKIIKPIQDRQEAENALINLLNYYFLTQNYPAPLLPDWVPKILEGNESSLQKHITTYIEDLSIKDPNFWLMHFQDHPPASKIIEIWRNWALKLFKRA